MGVFAPLRMPVELTADVRFFRLSESVSEDGLRLSSGAPRELFDAKRLGVAFHLPGDPRPIQVHGALYEVRLGEDAEERAELLGLRFLDLDPDGHARIAAYVEEWIGRTV